MVIQSGSAEYESAPAILDLDHVFNALAHPRRRYVVYTLIEANEWSLWELSAKLAAWERDVPRETISEEEIEPMYVSLYHNHVPKLVEDDIIEFSEATETVARGANAGQVLKVLENAGGASDSRQEAHARSDRSEGQT